MKKERIFYPIMCALNPYWWIVSNTLFFYKQLGFPSEPGVANEILENEAESCLAVA